jgi:hypothetical protein
MKKLLLAIALLAIGIGGYALLRTEGQYAEPIPAMSEMVPELKFVPPEPRPPLSVILNDDLGPDTKALHEQLAKVLSAVGPPDDRLAFYAALFNTPGFRVIGWSGILEDAEPIPGGYLVTLRIAPNVESDEFGPKTVINSQYREQYRVIDGNVQYVGFLDPEGMFGKFPDDIRGY